MADLRERLLPWALLVLALPVALWAIGVTAPAACNELPDAFRDGGTTSYNGGVESFIVDHCERTESDGSRDAVTIINWSGLSIALGLCAGAWFLGAALVGRVARRLGAGAIAVSAAAVALGAAPLL